MTTSVFQNPLRGNINVPGSKSITNRVFPLSVLSSTPIVLKNALNSEDAEIMRTVLSQLHAEVQAGENENEWIVSRGDFFSHADHEELFCGNSGTTLRFMAALAVLRNGPTTFTGIERMKERPIGDLIDALRQLGVNVEYHESEGFPPFTVYPNPLVQASCSAFSGMKKSVTPVRLSGKLSSQFFTALFHIAPILGLEIIVTDELVSKPYIDMTIEIMRQFGVEIQNENYQKFTIPQQKIVSPSCYTIEADASSATYPLAIAALTVGEVEINNLPNPSLQGDAKFKELVIDTMNSSECEKSFCLKPLGEMHLADIPDAAMTAVVLAACADGYSKIMGLSTLRHKECDRIFALESNLKKMGCQISSGDDFMEVWGDPKTLHGADIECFNDHRVAMCFGVLGTVIEGVNILDPECTQKTYPEFWKDLEQWRMRV